MTVDDYIENLDGWKEDAAQQLRDLVRHHVPQVQEEIKWKQPYFSYNGPICYFSAFKNHINFGFPRGAELDDPNGLLEGTGKNMRHIKVGRVDDIDPDGFGALIQEARNLNEADA